MAESEREEKKTEQIKEVGSINLNENKDRHRIKLLTIIGEIEGHEVRAPSSYAGGSRRQ